MAIPSISAEQRDDILKVVVGLFNAAPGSAYITELANAVQGGMSISELSDALAANPIFQSGILNGSVTRDDQVNILLDHFGLVADDDANSAGSQAKAYFDAKLQAGEGFGKIVSDAVTYLSGTPADEFKDTATLLNNKILVAAEYSKHHESTDLAKLQSIVAGVSSSFPTTATEAAQYLDDIGEGSNPGVANDYTFGADTLVGTAGNDTFTAGVVNNGAGTLVQSLEDIDTADGAGGKDTLNVTLNTAGTVTPSISNIEVINIRNVTASATVDFTDTTGAEQIWNNGSTSTLILTYEAAPIAATFGVRNSKSITDINTFDDVSGTKDNLSLAVQGAGSDTADAVIQSTTDAANIETMSIEATGNNFVDVSAFAAITSLTVTGKGALEAAVDVTALDTVNASDNSGGVTVDLTGAAADLTVTGGSGNDDITAGTGDDTIDAKAGDDRVAFASGELDANDTVEGGEGADTIALIDGDDVAGLTADAVTGFEQLEIGAAGAAVSFDNADFDYTKVILGDDLTQDLTLNNVGTATLEVKDDQSGDINVTSAGADDTFSLSINAEEAVPTVTLAALDVTDIEAVNISTAAETDDTTITTIEADGAKGLTLSGAGDITINDITDADAANNATAKITNVDLTNQTGGFVMDANNLGYGTKFTLGDLGNIDAANTTNDFDLDGDGTDDASSQIVLTTGARDTVVFGDAISGNIVISDAEVGGDVGDDKFDLSALGLTSIDDLVFTDLASGDVQITAAADQFAGQILIAGVTSNEINNSDFIF